VVGAHVAALEVGDRGGVGDAVAEREGMGLPDDAQLLDDADLAALAAAVSERNALGVGSGAR
jgi:hypothetical protein